MKNLQKVSVVVVMLLLSSNLFAQQIEANCDLSVVGNQCIVVYNGDSPVVNPTWSVNQNGTIVRHITSDDPSIEVLAIGYPVTVYFSGIIDGEEVNCQRIFLTPSGSGGGGGENTEE